MRVSAKLCDPVLTLVFRGIRATWQPLRCRKSFPHVAIQCFTADFLPFVKKVKHSHVKDKNSEILFDLLELMMMRLI